ncbi:hypothetical protein ABZ723_15570 [Streptomyces sp. NPDC006700]|uniref:hypothetical protein n=1 Tax=Streptomyces sp. NPDC006700 TaxID=3154479 RepID=UPI00340FD909
MSAAEEGLHPPAEASLIRIARQAQGLSPESAAGLLPIRLSGVRWRQIENGYERKNPPKPVRAPAKTLAHMAHVVDVSPERLEEAGREDAAEILREILHQGARAAAAAEPSPLSSHELQILQDLIASTVETLGLTPEEAEEAFRRARRQVEERRAAEGRNDPPAAPRSSRSAS